MTSKRVTTPKGGRPKVYADELFVLAVMISAQLHLGVRGVAGVLGSLSDMYGLNLPIPHFTTIARRAKRLGLCATSLMPPRGRVLPDLDDSSLDEVFVHLWPGQGASDIAIDGTGLSVKGPGLYRTQHAQNKTGVASVSLYARVVVLTHLDTGAVQGFAVATSNRWSEDELARILLAEFLKTATPGQVKRFSADGLYDKAAYYQLIQSHSPHCQMKVPPSVNAKKWHPALLGSDQRNKAIQQMRDLANTKEEMPSARRTLKQTGGYMQRNLVETFMSRLVKLSGGRLRGQTPASWSGYLIGLTGLLNYHATCGWPDRDRLWSPP